MWKNITGVWDKLKVSRLTIRRLTFSRKGRKQAMEQAGIGLYGDNGHQVSVQMIEQAGGRLLGVSAMEKTSFADDVKVYPTLEDMLSDPRIELVSVCSPRRSCQAEDIKKIIRAGKHVYAEKPCVMDERDLDEILDLAKDKKVIFCEMDGSLFDRPYNKARQLVQQGILGEIVQVFVQKSYPYADFRPQDEDIDGGLILQCAVYGARFIEHIAGMEILEVTDALETSQGNPKKGDLRMACGMQMKLQNGAIASVIANYLNPASTGVWGNEELRIFGTKGYLKTNILDASVDVYTNEGKLHFESEEEEGLFQRLTACISRKEPFSYSPEYLTHPTRMVLRARQKAVLWKGRADT